MSIIINNTNNYHFQRIAVEDVTKPTRRNRRLFITVNMTVANPSWYAALKIVARR